MTGSRVQAGVPAGGQFTTQHRTEGDVELVDPTDHPFNPYRYLPADAEQVVRFPANVTEARAALRNTRGEPDGAVRTVFLDMRSLPREADVVGPSDGRPLLVVIESGFGRLNIRSGNVVVRAASQFGNSIHAHGDSKVTVIAAQNRKVSTSAVGRSSVVIIPDSGAHGYQGVYGPHAHTVIEDVGTYHRMTVYEHRDRDGE